MNSPRATLSKLVILTCFLVVFGCSASDKSIEDDLYACLVEHYQDNDINLSVYLDSIEEYLIQQDILSSKCGKGKIDYYKKIIDNGKVTYAPKTDMMIIVANYYASNEQLVRCLQSKPTYDSLVYYTSNFYLKSEKISQDVSRLVVTTPASASKAIVANLSESDFEHPFYRAHMLISFVMANDRNKAYVQNHPKKETSPTYPDSTGIIIDIRTPDTFLVNNQHIQKTEIEARLLAYLQDFNEHTHVRFIVSEKTIYQQFADVDYIILQAYNKRWDQASRKEFNKPFDQLSGDQQEIIKEKYPHRIVEVMPK